MKVQCKSNLDMFRYETFPDELPAVPHVGDLIESAKKYGNYVVQLEVVRVVWKQSSEKRQQYTHDGFPVGSKEVWYPEIELHLPKGRFETLTKFYEWYESISVALKDILFEDQMGIEQHNCVIAISWKEEEVKKVVEWINKLQENYKRLFLIGPEVCNGYRTIVMTPDGSKHGWDYSNKCDEVRIQFKELVKSWRVIEVTFGELLTEIVK